MPFLESIEPRINYCTILLSKKQHMLNGDGHGIIAMQLLSLYCKPKHVDPGVANVSYVAENQFKVNSQSILS